MPARRPHKLGLGKFGQRLKSARLERNLGVVELADLVGCACSQITGAENRGVVLHLDTLVAIAKALNCSMDYLCGLEDINGKQL